MIDAVKNISFKKLILVLAAVGIVTALDQLTKSLIVTSFKPGQSVPVIDGIFNLVLVFNKGAAFGLLSGITDGVRSIVLGLTTAVALCAVFYFLIVEYFEDSFAKCALGLILGGAFGNIIDRIRLGEVIDFLDFYWKSYHWPAFNVADSAICVGVFILLIRTPKKKK